ncbi:signal transduction histidine kinase [Dysgonomonas sp. PFB1-18]|uniref:sensor histidine kinase n=1 Tax=unclassified Dysgonomonas TaxID=2630389 RepID=UPI002476C111|nr:MULTISPECIES: HAMP domain-containing sensor histidine kinase [unclassified Dysgonomonas]MDH6309729.1 signal transduction histidine kinase [Dysgonomonas sp. PF1-14]MDH6339263.1 signal transduction histidine kinase [Dysgonomonas sp. PF1-16]MDH6380762.1 signal transduction histidine kinase [Dysgonomonas sp. PFB1-18]MDH6398258.1 signal transduction histidine kinase [Dysgonomonas sp. PF1-23]
MKLSNHLTLRLAAVFMLVIFVWSIIYFVIQMKEVYDGIDEGLNNLKQEFVYKANNSPDFVTAMLQHNPLNIIVEKISYEEAQDFKEIYSESKVYFVTEEEDEEVRMLTTAFYCEQDGQYYKLKFFTSTVERDDMVKNMLYLLIALWLCLALAIVVVIKKIIHRSNKPFYELLDNLKAFRLENTKMINFPVTDISEYKELNESVRSLLEDNINAFREQKNFIENASHEMQTPLAIAVGKLEMMIDGEGLDQKQVEDIHSILGSMSRMKRLNSSLLLLSKIKNKQFPASEDVVINTIVKETLEDFGDLVQHKKIKVSLQERQSIAVSMNKDLAYIMINNLVKNAVSHNIKGGKIDVVIDTDSLTLTNDGLPVADSINIFERYRSAGADALSSSGLGLSIVKSITDIYKFRIAYHYSDAHIFQLKFR